VLVFAFIFGAIFTPPDVISQLLLAIPVYLLYEVGIMFAKNSKKRI
jgi:sec-independent protein translocase protein TatC